MNVTHLHKKTESGKLAVQKKWVFLIQTYIQAILYDIDFTENEEDSPYREELEIIAREQGNEVLHQMLAEVDPASAETIHANNVLVWSIFGTSFRNAPHEVKSLSPNQGKIQTKKKKKKKKTI